jgi:hypothetical protein
MSSAVGPGRSTLLAEQELTAMLQMLHAETTPAEKPR